MPRLLNEERIIFATDGDAKTARYPHAEELSTLHLIPYTKIDTECALELNVDVAELN